MRHYKPKPPKLPKNYNKQEEAVTTPFKPTDEIEKLICTKQWDCKTAIAIFKAESGLRCNAIGDGSQTYTKNGIEYGKSYGIAQIRHLPGRPSPSQLLNCEFNLNYAYEIYQRQHWNPWSVYKTGKYKQFLN